MKENGNGKRKRSLGCARDDETRERLFTFFSFRYGSQPPPLRGTSFQRKEGECRFPALSFRAKARNLFRPLFPRPFAKPFRGSTASVLPRYGVSRSLLSNTLRLTANEKDPSAALGMTKRGNVSPLFFIPLRKPTFAPSGHLLPEEGGRMPASLHRHFERKREIFFVPFSHDPFAKPFRGSTASVLP